MGGEENEREGRGEMKGREGASVKLPPPPHSGLGVSLCGPIAVLCVGLTHSIHIHTEQMCVCLCVSVYLCVYLKAAFLSSLSHNSVINSN